MSEQWVRRLTKWKTIHYLNIIYYVYTFKPIPNYNIQVQCIQGDFFIVLRVIGNHIIGNSRNS